MTARTQRLLVVGLAFVLGWGWVSEAGAQTSWEEGDLAVGLNTGSVQVYGVDLAGVRFLKAEYQNLLSGVRDVSFDADRVLVVTDEFGRQTLRIGADGTILTTIDNSVAPVAGDTILKSGNIAFDVDGVSPLIADLLRANATGTVHLYDAAGNILDAASLPLSPQGSGSTGTGIRGFDVEVDADGDLAVTYSTAFGGNFLLRRKLFSTGAAVPLIQIGGSFNEAVRLLPEVIDDQRSFLLARNLDVKYVAYDSGLGSFQIMQSYSAPGANVFRTASPSADGSTFWTGSGQAAYEFDLATGAILVTIPNVVDGINPFSEINAVALAGAFRAAAVAPSPEPDLALSTIETDRAVISSFGGLAALSLELIPVVGTPVDLSGLDVQFSTTPSTPGLLGTVTNTGNTYFVDLTGLTGVSTVDVTATIDGVPLASAPVTISLVPMEPALSTVEVNPLTTVIGAGVVVTVTPLDDVGDLVGAGGTVVIGSTNTQALTNVVDNGDGTYSQAFMTLIDGTESYTATYDGLEVLASAQLQVVNPANLGNFIGVTTAGAVIDTYETLQAAIDAALVDSVETIFVQPGVYAESVRVRDVSNLTIEALSTPTEPVVVNGFRFHRASDITVRGFEIDAMDRRHAVRIRNDEVQPSSGIQIDDCTILNASRHGVSVGRGTAQFTATGLDVQQSGRHGIVIGRESTDALVQASSVSDSGRDGIRVRRNSTDVSLIDNTIENSGRHGIGVGREATDVTIDGNTIDHSCRDGIRVNRSANGVTIQNNAVADSARRGIVIGRDGMGVLISQNTVARSGRDGVRIHRDAAVQIEFNLITESGLNGNDRNGYAIHFSRSQTIAAALVTLVQNVFSTNNGRPSAGRSDQDVKNFDTVIDATDDQAPYTP